MAELTKARAETATVYRVGSRRFFTLKAAERAECKAAIREFERGDGDHMSPEDFHAVIKWLLPKVQMGFLVTPDDVAAYFNAGREALKGAGE